MAREYEHRGRALIEINPDDKEYPLEIRVATQQGFLKGVSGGGIYDLSFPNSKLRRARSQDFGRICPTITCSSSQLFVITVEERDADI